MGLEAFLNPIGKENRKTVISERFKNKDGEIEKWELKAVSATQDDEMRKRASLKGGFNSVKYMTELAIGSVVYPDLKNEELQNAYGVMGEEALLKAMLTAGEYATLCDEVQKQNDFADDKTLTEEAKN